MTLFCNAFVETEARSGIDLQIAQGEYVAVMGSSGCGKSTLLSMMGLLDAPSRGRYVLAGAEVTRLFPSDEAKLRNRMIAFVCQAFNLIGDMTVGQNVELPLTHRDLSRRERKA